MTTTMLLLMILSMLYSSLQIDGQKVINRTFIQPATGPSKVCVGSSVIFNCTIKVSIDSGVGTLIVDAKWTTNGVVINDSTPGYTLLRTQHDAVPVVTGLKVDNIALDDDETVYSCTVNSAPADFVSSVVLNVTGDPPSPKHNITVGDTISSTIVSWIPFISDPVCGLVSYDVILLPSTGVNIIRLNDTSYNFTGLIPGIFYNVTVVGRNVAGIGESITAKLSTPRVDMNNNINTTPTGRVNDEEEPNSESGDSGDSGSNTIAIALPVSISVIGIAGMTITVIVVVLYRKRSHKQSIEAQDAVEHNDEEQNRYVDDKPNNGGGLYAYATTGQRTIIFSSNSQQ